MARDRSGPGRRIIGIVERKEGRNRWKTIGANNTKQITFDIQLTVIIEPQLRPIVARFPSCFSPISWQHGGAPPPKLPSLVPRHVRFNELFSKETMYDFRKYSFS